jgi:hypothetical protein
MPSRSGTPSGAMLTKDRRYRYRLWRSWADPELRCLFVGLNPSTADETNDDPTIRKCVGFAKRWGFGAVDVVNLFALRSTDPAGLLADEDPVGRRNRHHLTQAFKDARRIVWAWGSHGPRIQRLILPASISARRIERVCEVGTLGTTRDGSPRHPLMLAYATGFKPDDGVAASPLEGGAVVPREATGSAGERTGVGNGAVGEEASMIALQAGHA